jgi:hypothetical protein
VAPGSLFSLFFQKKTARRIGLCRGNPGVSKSTGPKDREKTAAITAKNSEP